MKTFVLWLAHAETDRETYLDENEQEDTGQPLTIVDAADREPFCMVQAVDMETAVEHFVAMNHVHGTIRAFEVNDRIEIASFQEKKRKFDRVK